MDVESNQDIWQVETGGNIFEANFDEMASWIADGSLLKIDRVRKGNLRWIEAGKVPSLLEFFNAHDSAAPPAPVITMTHKERLGVVEQPKQFVNQQASTASAADVCTIHGDVPAKYFCETCSNFFCKACPTGYGANVKICPLCGAMCKEVGKSEVGSTSHQPYREPITEKFGFADFGRAIAYPFKFKASLVMGALMFMFFSVGQGIAGFGGIFMMFSALACFLLANTLTFGILANTVDNFSQGKLDENFMPSFEDFSLWESVVHPFFLNIGVYVASFWPLVLAAIVAFYLISGPTKTEMNGLQSDAARVVSSELPYAAKAANQSQAIKDLLGKQADVQKKRIVDLENGNVGANSAPATAPVVDQSEINADKAQQLIEQAQKAQLEATLGKTPETKESEQQEMIKQFLARGTLPVLLIGAAFLWGLFYFPAALAVAGYTRSLGATLNPMVGLDTIRHLGFDYVKILVMAVILGAASLLVGGILAAVFKAFDLPGLGNVPANAIGSLFAFYLSVVFSCTLAFALYKGSDRLKLAR